MDNGRRPVSALGRFHRGELLNDPAYLKMKAERMNPDSNFGLGVCRVVNLDYEEHFVTLRTMLGSEQEFERIPVPLTYPGAGTRHFLGAMPEVGDYCVVGWMPQESGDPKGGTKTPVILSWIVPGVWPGRDWLTTAGFTEDEHDSGTGRNREEVRGTFDRIRHKLPAIHPGNIVASSSQGADLMLDESVLLANRRGNEFMLRDADQAAVIRALQHFIALSGTRSYSGMVQRDALLLPTTMFSDGKEWDGLNPQPPYLLPFSSKPTGFLSPDQVFDRSYDEKGVLGAAQANGPDYLDPYVFLRNGGWIDEAGVAVDGRHIPDAVAEGKNIYRVGLATKDNVALVPGGATLTEHRIEIAHTSDGTLPVSEQTDGFDADRLPGKDPDTPGDSANKPYIEWVMGSVVGNDAFSKRGRTQYGLPLVAQVFDGAGGLSPTIKTATLVPKGKNGGTPLGEHAATLFKLTPPASSGRLAPTWWSVNKQGQVRANISGPSIGYGLDLAVAGGMRLAVGGGLELLLKGGIHFGTLSKNSLRLRSEQGPVVIYGGGPEKGAEANLERQQGTNGGEGTVPSVDIHARTNLRLRAEKQALLKAQKAEINARTVNVLGQDEIEMSSSKALTFSTEDAKFSTTGKRTDTFTGPKYLLPTNGALHERTYTPSFPGLTAEEVTYQLGDRQETFNLGSHSTSILIGNMTYETELGVFEARALQNKVTLGPAGASINAAVGNVSLQATAGAATMKASVGVVIEATGGPVVMRSSSVMLLGAPVTGTDAGPIICAGSREPFTNLPFATWGLGAKNHIVGT